MAPGGVQPTSAPSWTAGLASPTVGWLQAPQLLALHPQPQLGRILQPPPCTPGHDGSLSPRLPSHRDPAQGSGRWGAKPLLFPPPLHAPKSGCRAAHPPGQPPHALTAAAPPLPDGAGATPHRREPSAGRASPALPFIPAPAGARALYPEAPHYRTGSQLVPFRDLGWVILAGPVVRAPSPSQTGRREPDLGTSRLQADSRVPGEPRHLPALSARSRGSLLPHVHSPRVPRGSAGCWGHGGGLGDNPAFQQPPRPARIPAMPLPRTRLPRAPGALRGHRGTDPAQPLSTPPSGKL